MFGLGEEFDARPVPDPDVEVLAEPEDEHGRVLSLVAPGEIRVDGGRDHQRLFFDHLVVRPLILARNGAEKFGDDRAAAVGVGHDDRPAPGARVKYKVAAKARVGAVVGEL